MTSFDTLDSEKTSVVFRDNQRLVVLMGLQRSGNHAVANWIGSLFSRSVHLNDLAHKEFSRVQQWHFDGLLGEVDAVTLERADCIICSFEDSRDKMRDERSFIESIGLRDDFILRADDLGAIPFFVLRDPYNTLSSRIKANEKFELTSDPSIETFIQNWKDIARLYQRDPRRFILYNTWHSSESYRRQICDRLGGTYNERTLNEVLPYGGGSSFEGHSNQSAVTLDFLLRNLPRYASIDFAKRFLRNKRYYFNRLRGAPVDGTRLETGDRWRFLVNRPDCVQVFQDAEMGSLCREIFGFEIDFAGPLRPQS